MDECKRYQNPLCAHVLEPYLGIYLCILVVPIIDRPQCHVK